MKVERFTPGRKRKISQTVKARSASGFSSLEPTKEVNPSRCPISCTAVLSKSILFSPTPSRRIEIEWEGGIESD